jgi:hypothetical protein
VKMLLFILRHRPGMLSRWQCRPRVYLSCKVHYPWVQLTLKIWQHHLPLAHKRKLIKHFDLGVVTMVTLLTHVMLFFVYIVRRQLMHPKNALCYLWQSRWPPLTGFAAMS